MTVPAGLTRPAPPAPRRARPLLCALGDSASAGVGDRLTTAARTGLRDAPGCGWPVHLGSVLGADVRNLGRNGARARDVLVEQLPVALAARPDLATVLVGGNDVLRGDLDLDEVSDAVARVTAALLDGGAHVALVVPPGFVDLPAPALVRRVLGERMERVRDAVRGVGAALARPGLTVVDADPLRAAGRDVLHVDRIHPSPRGHRLLAGLVARELGPGGWPASGVLDPVPPVPGPAQQAAWLLVRGAPWFARRSRDLLPELARLVLVEERARRRRAAAQRVAPPSSAR